MVAHRVFVHIAPLAIDAHCRAFHGKFHRVAVELLQQAAAHAKGHVLGRKTRFVQIVQNLPQRREVDAVALNDAHVLQHLEALAVGGVTKTLRQYLHHLRHGNGRIARVGAYHHGCARGDHRIAQLLPPNGIAGVKDIVAVAHYGYHAARPGKLAQHVAVGICLVLASPAGDGAVLGRRNGKACHLAIVVASGRQQGADGIRAHEIDQMRHAAQRCRFQTGYAACAKVVQFEGQLLLGAIAGGVQIARNDGFGCGRLGGNCGGVPHGAQQFGFDEAGEPEKFGVGVFYREQHIAHRQHHAFGHSANAQGQQATVFFHQARPARFIERLAMCGINRLGFGHIRQCNRRAQILAQISLQAKEQAVTVAPPARFDVAEGMLGTRWILQPVRGLVRIGAQQQVVAQSRFQMRVHAEFSSGAGVAAMGVNGGVAGVADPSRKWRAMK